MIACQRSRLTPFGSLIRLPTLVQCEKYRVERIQGLWQILSNLYGDSFCKLHRSHFDLYINGFISELDLKRYLIWVAREFRDGAWSEFLNL